MLNPTKKGSYSSREGRVAAFAEKILIKLLKKNKKRWPIKGPGSFFIFYILTLNTAEYKIAT